MKRKELIDNYTDYLITSTSLASCTGLSKVLKEEISHDKFTRLLAGESMNGKELWKLIKPTVREIETDQGILVFDDSIAEKPYTDENEMICWHYDHSKGRSVKGINLLTGLYVGQQDVSLPVVYDLVKKDLINEKGKRQSSRTKNEMMRDCLDQAINNQIRFKWVITDIWFGSSENMNHILSHGREFIIPLKTNRKVALSAEDRRKGRYVPITSLCLEQDTPLKVWLEKIPSPLTLIKQEFVNKDGSVGALYLVCSDETATYEQITTLYKKRWKVEEYHKSLKNNASLTASPTKTVKTQANHVFMSLVGYCKLELFKMKKGMNHFALKATLYTKAMMAALQQLRLYEVGVQLKFDFA